MRLRNCVALGATRYAFAHLRNTRTEAQPKAARTSGQTKTAPRLYRGAGLSACAGRSQHQDNLVANRDVYATVARLTYSVAGGDCWLRLTASCACNAAHCNAAVGECGSNTVNAALRKADVVFRVT